MAEPTMDEIVSLQNELTPCETCGRTFLPQSLDKHIRVCERNATRKRKVFDSLKQRVEGTELEQFHQKSYLKRNHQTQPAEAKPPKPNLWKEKHIELIQTIRAARGVETEMPNAVKGTGSVTNVGSERCPSCDRQFGPKAFDRHVEWCKDRQTRVQKSPAQVLLAKERLEARTKYRVPLPNKSKRVLIRDKYLPGVGERAESVASIKSVSTPNLERSPSIRKPKLQNFKRVEKNKVEEEVDVAANKREVVGVKKQIKEKSVPKEVIVPTVAIEMSKSPHANPTKSTQKLNSLEINTTNEAMMVSHINAPEFKSKEYIKMVTWKETANKNNSAMINNNKTNLKKTKSERSGNNSCASSVIDLNIGDDKNKFDKPRKRSPHKMKNVPLDPAFTCSLDNSSICSNNETKLKTKITFGSKIPKSNANLIVNKFNKQDLDKPTNKAPNAPNKFNRSARNSQKLSLLDEESVQVLRSPDNLRKIAESPRESNELVTMKNGRIATNRLLAKPKDKHEVVQVVRNKGSLYESEEDGSFVNSEEDETNETIKIVHELKRTKETVCESKRTIGKPQVANIFKKPKESSYNSELGETDWSVKQFGDEKTKELVLEFDEIKVPVSRNQKVRSHVEEEVESYYLEERTSEPSKLTKDVESEEESNEIVSVKRKTSDASSKTENLLENDSKDSLCTVDTNGTNGFNDYKSSSSGADDNNLDDGIVMYDNKKYSTFLQNVSDICKMEKHNKNQIEETVDPLKQILKPVRWEVDLTEFRSPNSSKSGISSKANDSFKRPDVEEPTAGSSSSSKSAVLSVVNETEDLGQIFVKKQKNGQRYNFTNFENETTVNSEAASSFETQDNTNYNEDAFEDETVASTTDTDGIIVHKAPNLNDDDESLSDHLAEMWSDNEKPNHSNFFSRRSSSAICCKTTDIENNFTSLTEINLGKFNDEDLTTDRILELGGEQFITNFNSCGEVGSTEDEIKYLSQNSSFETIPKKKQKMSDSLESIVRRKSAREAAFLKEKNLTEQKQFFYQDEVMGAGENWLDLKRTDIFNNSNVELSPRVLTIADALVQERNFLIAYEDCEETDLVIISKTHCKTLLTLDPNLLQFKENVVLPRIKNNEMKGNAKTSPILKKDKERLSLPSIDSSKIPKKTCKNDVSLQATDSSDALHLPKINQKSIDQFDYNPFITAERQFMELLECDDFKPFFSNSPSADITQRPRTTTKVKQPNSADIVRKPLNFQLNLNNNNNNKRASVIDPPCDFQDALNVTSDDFELMESLVNQNLLDSEFNGKTFNLISSHKVCKNLFPQVNVDKNKYFDDLSPIDPRLINENDNLTIPENLEINYHSLHSSNENVASLTSKNFCKDNKKVLNKASKLVKNNKQLIENKKFQKSKSRLKDTHKSTLTTSSLTSSGGATRNNLNAEKNKNLPLLKKAAVTVADTMRPKNLKNKQDVENYFEEQERKSAVKSEKVNVDQQVLKNNKNDRNHNPTPEEQLFAIDDEMYEEYKKYEEVYLREKQNVDNRKKSEDVGSAIEEVDGVLGINSADSAYSSLNRNPPKIRARATKLAPLLRQESQSSPVDSQSSSSSEASPLFLDVNVNLKMSKFCHECGNKYPIDTAKFCVECGIKRLIL